MFWKYTSQIVSQQNRCDVTLLTPISIENHSISVTKTAKITKLCYDDKQFIIVQIESHLWV